MTASSTVAPVVIIGSGLGGWTLARELRQRDAAIPITLICADNGDFYSKPMLSNAFLNKKEAHHLIQAQGSAQAEKLAVRLIPNTRITAIHRDTKDVETSTGERIAYRQLVLALGADVFRPPTEGIEHALSVNDLNDYANFRKALQDTNTISGAPAKVVTIGGGLIGSEFANDLANGGHEVHVVDMAAWPVGNLVSAEQGRALQTALENLGVQFYFEDVVEKIVPQEQGFQLRLRSGKQLQAHVILSAVGLRPRTQLAESAGLKVERGIVVDTFGRTTDTDIFALGDCAAYTSAAKPELANGAARALPYVMPLMTAAKAVAATLAGTETPIQFGAMPVRVKTPAHPLTITG